MIIVHCALYGGPFEHACMWQTILIHDRFNNKSYQIWQAPCECFQKYYGGSYVVYGNYVWCSDKCKCDNKNSDMINKKHRSLYVFNILTNEYFYIKQMNECCSFKKVDTSLYLYCERYPYTDKVCELVDLCTNDDWGQFEEQNEW